MHCQSRCPPPCTNSRHGLRIGLLGLLCPMRFLHMMNSLLQNIFMTEWVAIFRESGLRDDVTVENFQEAYLRVVVLARARARELQVALQVERAQQPLSAKTAAPTTKSKSKPSAASSDKPVCRFCRNGCKSGDQCQYSHPRTNGKCLQCGSEAHSLQDCTRPRRARSSRTSTAKPGSRRDYAAVQRKLDEKGNACSEHKPHNLRDQSCLPSCLMFCRVSVY